MSFNGNSVTPLRRQGFQRTSVTQSRKLRFRASRGRAAEVLILPVPETAEVVPHQLLGLRSPNPEQSNGGIKRILFPISKITAGRQ